MIARQQRQLTGMGDGPSTSKLFYFPSDIKAAVEQTETEMSALADDFERFASSYDGDSPQWEARNGFMTVYNEWRQFADNLGIWAKMAGSTVSQAQDFRLRAKQWRDRLVAMGGRPSTPEPMNLPSDTPSPWASTLKSVAGAAIAVAVVYGIAQVMPLLGAVVPRAPARANPRRRRRRRRVRR